MTLKWSIDQAKGRLMFGKLLPMAGNTYEVAVSGQTEGAEYTFYVMDESGEKCLARSTRNTGGAYSIAFNTKDLRESFKKEWHEIRAFHTVVSDGENTIAEGDLSIVWNHVWTDQESGEAYSMKGEPGEPGAPGADARVNRIVKTGEDADGNFIYSMVFDDGQEFAFLSPKGPRGFDAMMTYLKEYGHEKYHECCVMQNSKGQWVLAIEQEGIVPEATFDEATIQANVAARDARWYALGRFTEDDPPVLVTEGAKQYCDRAETAATTAETAQTAAETAQTEAEAAQTAAETAQTAAETAQIAAETAQTAAETAQTAAETAQTAAETASDTAVTTVQGALGNIETAKTNALSAVETKKTQSVTAVQTAQTTAVSAVQAAQTAGVGAVQSAQTTAVNAVQNAQGIATDDIDAAKQEAISQIQEQTNVVHVDQEETISAKKTYTAEQQFNAGILATGVAHKTGVFSTNSTAYATLSLTGLKPSTTYAILLLCTTTSTSTSYYLRIVYGGVTYTFKPTKTIPLSTFILATSDASGNISFTYSSTSASYTQTARYLAIPL